MARKLKIALSVKSASDCYQKWQISSAQEAVARHSGELVLLDAGNDSIKQSQQLLDLVQSKTGRPDAIVLDPVGTTGLPHVAKAAASSGIGWAVLGGQVDYLAKLREEFPTPVFSVAIDEIEVGKIQGRQLAATISDGANVLYMQGPYSSRIAHLRATGFQETKPANCEIKTLACQWTMASAARSVDLWLWLAAVEAEISVVVGQSNLIALGAREALSKNILYKTQKDLVFLGGGLTPVGPPINDESLDATVLPPSTSGRAIDVLVPALRTGSETPESISVAPYSGEIQYPSLPVIPSSKQFEIGASFLGNEQIVKDFCSDPEHSVFATNFEISRVGRG